MNEEIRFIDLFGGIGGFRIGLEQTSPIFKCVWYCDKKPYAVKIYNKRFKENYKATDITTIDTGKIPDHDLLCAGFPCQGFSVAGKREGFNHTQGTMFFEICRIAKHKRPSYLFLENVNGLLNHNKGETFCTILNCLDGLGYNVEWQVINSKHFTGQNRKRVYIIGHLRERCWRPVLPIDIKYRVHIKASKETWKNHLSCFTGRSPKARLNIDSSYIVDKKGLRSPTPLEWERGQGFPDGWTKGLSDARRYELIGNAVTTNVIKSIGESLLKHSVEG